MNKILIASGNSHKQKKLKVIVKRYFKPIILSLPKIQEQGHSFRQIAEDKAKKYSLWFDGWAVATDAGAIIPALKKWDALRTRRFVSGADKERINKLLQLMKGKKNRHIYWHEAVAVANKGKIIFSVLTTAMPAILEKRYNQDYYEAGHWLDSLCYFPKFKKNFFELNKKERLAVENSWTKIKTSFNRYFQSYKTIKNK